MGTRAKSEGKGLLALALIALLALTATAQATHSAASLDGRTTVTETIRGDGAADYEGLEVGPGEDYTVREGLGAVAGANRAAQRSSLVYFGQLSDFQLVDEESPARVEFVDPAGDPVTSAFRPMEAFTAQGADQAVRQLNNFTGASPIAAGDGSQRAMDFTITTGDSADNMQKNETKDVIGVLAGGTVDPNSGVPVSGGLPEGTPASTCNPAQQAYLATVIGDAEAGRYTGVQDFDDYPPGNNDFYDPDEVQSGGDYENFPLYPGLMDRAQTRFEAEGLDVPAYVTFGNHDALAQGNQAMNRAIEDIAIGCTKPLNFATDPANLFAGLPDFIAGLPSGALPGGAFTVHPDPERQAVSKAQYKKLHTDGDPNDNGFGFGEIDDDQEAASNGAAGYYSYSPQPGFRFIAVDTVSEGGVTGPSANGNIDDPQFQWLSGELDAAAAADERVLLFSHHGPQTLNAPITDEMAPPCSGSDDQHGHDQNPGCDLDPRNSSPIHTYDGDVETLLFDHPNVIAWVNGHSHLNSVMPEENPAGGGFWDIRTAAEIDWPQQSRLLEIFDNEDGTLSIFGTILDHSAPVSAPADGDASSFSSDQLASIGRELAFNDPQTGSPNGEGEVNDRNVELLIDDPLAAAGGGGGGNGNGGDGGAGGGIDGDCAEPTRGTDGDDVLVGDSDEDGIRGLDGTDKIKGRAGDDCLFGDADADQIAGAKGDDLLKGGKGLDDMRSGPGADRVRGQKGGDSIRGGGGNDNLAGNKGRDVIRGGGGKDTLRGGKSRDRIRGGSDDDQINVRGGGKDVVNCGTGKDTVRAGKNDRVRPNCEKVKRKKK